MLDTLDTYIPFLPPRNKFYADPMLFKNDGVNYLFFEDYDYKKGVISYVTLDENGVNSNPIRVLELPIHLSFPYVFSDNGKIYMTPETYAAKEVSLFEAILFPEKWEKRRVLVKGEDFADPIIFKHGDYYFLFAAALGDELRVFYAKDLHSEFKPHPINKMRIKGRNAGGVYKDGDRLIRPVMDCQGVYGKAMFLKEIQVLTPYTFREKVIAYIDHTWAPDLDGTHTYNQNEDFVIYDGRRTIYISEDKRYSGSQ